MANPAKLFFKNPVYDGQFVRTVSATSVAAADLGEAFATARRIEHLSGKAWYEAWSTTADNAVGVGEEALSRGDQVSACEAFLRASEYYRQSYYFIRADLNKLDLLDAYRKHVAAFVAATELMETPVSRVRIPYDDTTLNAYLFTPSHEVTRRATILVPCGYDSTAEAGWIDVPAALAHGYNVLTFDGRGQGDMLFLQRRFFRPDVEQVVAQVIDWLSERPEVDKDHLVLLGRSFGGYLAPRAASVEHRLAALICDPAQPNMGVRIPSGPLAGIAAAVATLQMRLSSDRAEFFGSRMAAHGLTRIKDYFAEMRQFTMIKRADKITCPTLIIEAEHDFAGGGGQSLFQALHAPKQIVHLTAAQGADGHCAGLGQQTWNRVVYGWLTTTLSPLGPAQRPLHEQATR